jgi:hypothetical protein
MRSPLLFTLCCTLVGCAQAKLHKVVVPNATVEAPRLIAGEVEVGPRDTVAIDASSLRGDLTLTAEGADQETWVRYSTETEVRRSARLNPGNSITIRQPVDYVIMTSRRPSLISWQFDRE